MAKRLDDNWFIEHYQPIQAAYGYECSEKLTEVKSPFQTIEVYQTKGMGRMMVIDGCVMLSQRDNFLYHEMMTHPVLFTHPNPKRVVIIGGGDCGTMKEVLRHTGVEAVTQIDIDEKVTRLSEEYFPELCESNNDPRAELCFEDGIKWMADADAGSIDVVIVDSTDPIGPAVGLFNEAFYRSCFNALKDDGLLVQQSEAPFVDIELIKAMKKAMKMAGFNHQNLINFPQPVYPTGWWSALMASKNSILTEFREDDARNKSFITKYYNIDIHRGSLAVPEYMKE